MVSKSAAASWTPVNPKDNISCDVVLRNSSRSSSVLFGWISSDDDVRHNPIDQFSCLLHVAEDERHLSSFARKMRSPIKLIALSIKIPVGFPSPSRMISPPSMSESKSDGFKRLRMACETQYAWKSIRRKAMGRPTNKGSEERSAYQMCTGSVRKCISGKLNEAKKQKLTALGNFLLSNKVWSQPSPRIILSRWFIRSGRSRMCWTIRSMMPLSLISFIDVVWIDSGLSGYTWNNRAWHFETNKKNVYILRKDIPEDLLPFLLDHIRVDEREHQWDLVHHIPIMVL